MSKILVAYQKRTDEDEMPCYVVTANLQGCPPFFKRTLYDVKNDGVIVISAKDQAEELIKQIEFEGEDFFDKLNQSKKKKNR